MTRTFILYKSNGDSQPAEISEIGLEGLIRRVPSSDNPRTIFGFQVENNILTGIIVAGQGEKARLHKATATEACTLKAQDGVCIRLGEDWRSLRTKDADINIILGLMNGLMAA